jgi:CubicO group peptidase (beta-lactamase class C family)
MASRPRDPAAASDARARLDAVVDESLADGRAGSAVQLRVSAPGELLHARDAGFTRHATAGGADADTPRAPIGPRTRFDLASLTKPLATTALILQLVHEDRLALDEPPPVPAPPGVTLRHLLGHAAGLAAFRPYHRAYTAAPDTPPLTARVEILEAVAAEIPEAAPGARTLYSDLGFILLGWAVAKAGGARLDALFAERIARPLGLEGRLGFRPARAAAPADRAAFVATERCPWRGRLLAGEVHDETAWVMGGVAGHAGLFGDADAVDAVARAHHDAFAGRRDAPFPPAAVRTFWAQTAFPPPPRALGWDMPAPSGWSGAGTLFPRGAVGHLGFTGTSLWIDPASGLAVTLLANHVHPARGEEATVAIRALRPAVHDAAVALARACGLDI